MIHCYCNNVDFTGLPHRKCDNNICVGDGTIEETICYAALESNSYIEKGCTTPFMCFNEKHKPVHDKVFDCCETNMCNFNLTKETMDYYKIRMLVLLLFLHYNIKRTIYIIAKSCDHP